MGFDMYWQDRPDRAEGYFCLNWHGMKVYAEAMHRLGMLHEAEPSGPFPDPTGHGTTWGHVNAIRYDDAELMPTDPGSALEFIGVLEEYLAQHPGGASGIPSFKFSSNDSWWVTVEECRDAVAAYRTVGAEDVEAALVDVRQPHRPGYWDQWVAFVGGAASHGGFRVR